MNKSAIVSIVLIATICGFLLPMQAKAFQTPVPPYGPSDTNYNYYGPLPSTLLMVAYTSDTAEFSALQTGTIDMMDTLLTPTQYAAISSNPAITTGSVAATELVEYDLNNYFAPFNNTEYRDAFSYMINRTDYLNTYFAGGGTPTYDPLDFNPFGQAAEAYCAALYPTSFASAYSALVASGFQMVLENGQNGIPTLPGYFTWYFQTPFPTASTGTPAGPPPATAEAIPNATVQIFARTEHPERTNQAAYLQALLGVPGVGSTVVNNFATWAQSIVTKLGLTAAQAYFTSLGAPLPEVGGVPQYPVINIQVQLGTSEVADVLVMTNYRFEIYTGAWILDEFQDALEIWLSVEAPQNLGWGAFCLNYDSIIDPAMTNGEPTYDYYTFQSLGAAIPGYPSNEHTWTNTSMYWAIKAQDELMSLAGFIPLFYYSGYSAVLTRDNYTVNAIGTGFDNWFTYMDAQTPTGTLSWGWSSDLENPNPISSTWAWDWYALGPIYDSMVNANPYNLDILPGLGTNYTVVPQDPNNPYSPANFAATGENASTAYLQLRTDSYWQDLPAGTRNSYMYNDGSQLNSAITGQQVTPADVAFTYEYLTHDGQYQSVHLFSTVYDVGQVIISSLWKPLFSAYNTTYNNVLTGYSGGLPVYANGVPGYTWENLTYIESPAVLNGTFAVTGPFAPQNFIQFSNTMGPYAIQIYFTDTTGWFAYYAELGIPIIPMYIYANLAEASWPNSAVAPGFITPSEFSMVLDQQGANLLYGSGPYIWTGFTPGTYTFSAYVSGVSYGGVTEATSYWAQPVRVEDVVSHGEPQIIFDQSNELIKRVTVTNWSNNPITVSVTESFTPYWLVGNAWVKGTKQTITQTGITLGPNSNTVLQFNFPLPTPPAGATFMVPLDDPIITITADAVQPGFVGRVSGGSEFDVNTWPAYTEGIAVLSLGRLQGDISGAAKPTAPYYGADGVVNSKDVGPIAANWLATVPPGTNPTTTLARADINGDGVVNSKDVSVLAAHWLQTWNTAAQPTAAQWSALFALYNA